MTRRKRRHSSSMEYTTRTLHFTQSSPLLSRRQEYEKNTLFHPKIQKTSDIFHPL